MTTKRKIEAECKKLVGRTIVAVEANTFATGRGREQSADPVLVLDDGSRVSFTADETEIGECGVRPVVTKGGK